MTQQVSTTGLPVSIRLNRYLDLLYCTNYEAKKLKQMTSNNKATTGCGIVRRNTIIMLPVQVPWNKDNHTASVITHVYEYETRTRVALPKPMIDDPCIKAAKI